MDKTIITCLAFLAMSVSWSAAIEANKAAEKKTPTKTFTPVSTRNLRGEERTFWLASMRSKLPMAKREIGPFGLPQDPTKEVVKPQEKSVSAEAFLNAIKEVKVNIVNASDKKFAVGSREFSEGESFPLIRGERQFNTKVVLVTSDYIVFKDVNSGEHVKLNLNTLPPGLSKNSKLGSVKGVVPSSKKSNEPLNLD